VHQLRGVQAAGVAAAVAQACAGQFAQRRVGGGEQGVLGAGLAGVDTGDQGVHFIVSHGRHLLPSLAISFWSW
jgi:hypothetical protein